MAMKFSWFHHHECTTEQADELVEKYRARGVKTERSLNRDNITWTVSAQLPEGDNAPRPSRVWQSKAWR
ncbi:hypothetical protein DBU02_000380 [Escherichia coli O6]|uniref:hypothetical protein n=1 Tax=Escherichia coli TaxID=562 RepID=UPI000D6A2BBF|nr:hypothetical protein [Escherichia coli]EEZ5733957.1 hypothetical protein [Escherichia coli O6]MBB8928659.1 hypothetical protein [Escherichia coli]STJ39605.1 putative prophage protein [Escherichia coli]HAI2164520.1 hypothetical protein [Escherichia coli]